jgi:hypothetical protein
MITKVLGMILVVVTLLVGFWLLLINPCHAETAPSWVISLAQKHEQPVFPTAKDILAVIKVESVYNPKAVNGEARGLMQVAGGSLSPEENIRQGTKILSRLYRKYRSISTTFMVYNIGEGNYQSGIAIERGKQYSEKVMSNRVHFAKMLTKKKAMLSAYSPSPLLPLTTSFWYKTSRRSFAC